MILKRIILCLGLLLSVLSCDRLSGPDKPDNLIPEDKMVAILIDSKFITTANSSNKGVMLASNLDLDNYVYDKHNIDSVQFALSNTYYAYHIKTYEAIYAKAIDSLERLHLELKNLQAEEWKADTDEKAEKALNASKSQK